MTTKYSEWFRWGDWFVGRKHGSLNPFIGKDFGDYYKTLVLFPGIFQPKR